MREQNKLTRRRMLSMSLALGGYALSYRFRVRSINGMHPTANQRVSYARLVAGADMLAAGAAGR